MMMRLVIALDAVHHRQGVRHAGLLHPHRLEPAFQGLVLLDILAVLVKGRSANDLDLPAGEGRLEDVARIHSAFALACGGDGVDLVNKQDHIARSLDLCQQALDPLLKLAPELGASHQTGEVQQEDLLVLQSGRHLALGDALGDALCNGGLAHARLTDQTGVVLLAAAQDLDGAVDLPVTADDLIQAALPGFAGQILTIGVQELAAGLFALFAAVSLGGLPAGLLRSIRDPQGEGGAGAGHQVLAILSLRAVRVLSGQAHVHHHGQGVCVPQFLHHALHPVFHVVQVLLRHPELLHQIVHRLDMQLPGAVQAEALLLHLAVLHPLDEDDRRAFFASNTNHSVPSLLPPGSMRHKRVYHIEHLIKNAVP